MRTETIEAPASPAELFATGYDCVWIQLDSARAEDPVVQWVDWQLGSAISRFLSSESKLNSAVWIPTMGRLSSRFVVLQRESSESQAEFVRGCAGMQIRKVLWLGGKPPNQRTTFPEIVHAVVSNA